MRPLPLHHASVAVLQLDFSSTYSVLCAKRQREMEPASEANEEIKGCLYEDFEEDREAWNGQERALEMVHVLLWALTKDY
ncbi:hypothetical protein GOP47_0011200 [Adiantum capillus-veneris]|uniref:Uncharacterized protein n=1 Tax=Adiantum capillus-veneris TaxID=13818 RepID=A0A9D4UST2_ADICA|nr:hypothetical protein GOP47_0011200 [Adiantum capillus-veneris]